jgi:hypothetical protein
MSSLSSELRLLRRGRGVMVSDLHTRIGPILRARAGIGDSEGPSEARERLIIYLNCLAKTLPTDLSLIFSVALALNHDTQFRFLEERMGWLAAKLDRDVRTVSRRFNEALDLLDLGDGKVSMSERTNESVASSVNYQVQLPYKLVSLPPDAIVRVSFITVDIRRVK